MGLPLFPSYVILFLFIIQNFASAQEASAPETAVDVMHQVYEDCLLEGSIGCAKPRFISFLKKSFSQNKIRITRDLSIIPKEGEIQKISLIQDQDPENAKNIRTLERIENFIASHDLRMRLPRDLFSSEITNYVPQFLLKNLPEEIRVPLTPAAPVGQERRIVKKILLPFLLGLKFKATALLPLALALIALKTWKALTLGLLSMVLSGAMIIFKFSKPKLNYEVIHYAHHPHAHAHAHPIVEHANYEHYHAHGRSLPYRAYEPQETTRH